MNKTKKPSMRESSNRELTKLLERYPNNLPKQLDIASNAINQSDSATANLKLVVDSLEKIGSMLMIRNGGINFKKEVARFHKRILAADKELASVGLLKTLTAMAQDTDTYRLNREQTIKTMTAAAEQIRDNIREFREISIDFERKARKIRRTMLSAQLRLSRN